MIINKAKTGKMNLGVTTYSKVGSRNDGIDLGNASLFSLRFLMRVP